MDSIDLNTNVAVERPSERVRTIQAYGWPRQFEPAGWSRSNANPSSSRRLAGKWVGALTVAILIRLVLVPSALV